jgi:hypothetical protein
MSTMVDDGRPRELATIVATEAAASAKFCRQNEWLQLQPKPLGSQPLSIREAARLVELEKTIVRETNTFVEVGLGKGICQPRHPSRRCR